MSILPCAKRLLSLSWLIVLALASSTSAGELEGRWRQGNWIDTNRGHEGPLRAHFRQTDESHYRAVFTGRFFKVIPFRFATTLNVVGCEGDQLILAGESRVGLFGRFTYRATADAHRFHADYQSGRWQGEFNLQR